MDRKGFLQMIAGVAVVSTASEEVARPAEDVEKWFAVPSRGFISERPARDWQQGILTGNGTLGALVMGDPYDETLYLSHAALYLPQTKDDQPIEMASRLEEIRKLCLEGNREGAANPINTARKEYAHHGVRDPFIGAFALGIKQPAASKGTSRYQRAVNFQTAETLVSFADEQGVCQRGAFASRSDDVIVIRLVGTKKQTAEFSFAALAPGSDREKQMVTEGVRSSEQGLKDGCLYFQTLFAHTNRFNPNRGYEGVGKVIARGGKRTETVAGIQIADADEILVLVKIRPILKDAKTNFPTITQELNALTANYAALLARHTKLHGNLMGRVQLSLDSPIADRARSSESLNRESVAMEAPLAKIERAFDAGRYNIICSTGLNPPNLQGLWSGTWSAPWSGSFTTNGNLPAAVAFLLMGNTPELMHAYFRYYEDRWPGFRENAKSLYGMRGFHVPAQITLSPLETDFSTGYPHNYWHSSAAWTCQFYYDYFQYTGDRQFLAECAYPRMKEAAAFYEDFLTLKDDKGKAIFVPSYSPENAPGGERNVATALNATMDIAAARQLLRNTIAAAKRLDCDTKLQEKWSGLLALLPEYEVAPDGSFREWLWSGLSENNAHRHASHLYALFDEMPEEITGDATLVKAVGHTIDKRLAFRQGRNTGMAFGVVQLGLAAAHIGSAERAQETINLLAKGFWADGMASYHDLGNLFNMDISGGFPYLCASALVYATPGHIQFFPARPPQWTRGSLKGVRLRGGIVLRELTWNEGQANAVLVSDTNQTVMIEGADKKRKKLFLRKKSEVRFAI